MGIYSLSLLIGAANGLVLAGLVAASGRPASRLLAALIIAVVLRLTPYILGYAGAYDAHPWLTFTPFDLSWAYGPLLWGYVTSLTTGAVPPRWVGHLAPVALQLAYQLACFSLPLPEKWAWYTGPHLALVAPIGAAIGLVLTAGYLVASARAVRRYRAWLDDHYANRDEARLGWLTIMLGVFGLTLLIAAGFALTSWLVRPLDYLARFPLMLAFAALTYGLGLVGWRYGGITYPHASDALVVEAAPRRGGSTYRAQAQAWRARVVQAGWWRDETLDLAGLAERLAVSERTLSRGLSQGAGQTFREFLGRIRVEAVMEAMSRPENDATDLLTLALDAGFNAKASFNRVFRRFAGTTPTEYRRQLRGPDLRQSNSLADPAAH